MIYREESQQRVHGIGGSHLSRHFARDGRWRVSLSDDQRGVKLANATDEELLAAAAQAVVAAFRDQVQREHLSATSIAALRLLETALMLYQDRNIGRGG